MIHRHQYPSTVEASLNCGLGEGWTSRGHVVAKDGVILDALRFQKAIDQGRDYVKYCSRHGYAISTPIATLTSPERMERIVSEQASARARAKAKVAEYAAEFAGERIEPNVISIDALLEQENAGDEDLEAA